MMTTCLPVGGDLVLDRLAERRPGWPAAGSPSPEGTPSSSRPGHRQVARHGGADGEHDGVVAVAQLLAGDVDADVDAGAEPGALGLHLGQPAVEDGLLHLELGDAVAQQAAELVVPLVDGDGVAGAGQLLGGGQAGRAGADDGDGLAGEPVRRLRRRPRPSSKARSTMRDLDLLDGHGRLVDAEHARRLAGRRAEPAGELREVVGGVQPLDRLAPVAAPGQVVPLGDEVAQRAAVVAERDAAVHAAAGLALQLPRPPAAS